MRPIRAIPFFVFVAATLRAPAPLEAQRRTEPSPAQVRAWFDEAVGLQKSLHPLALRALQDPSVDRTRRAFLAAWTAAVRRADPALPKDWETLPRLHAAYREAQQRRDRAAAERARVAGLRLQARAVQAQARAWQDSEVRARAHAFQQALERRMIALDPSAAPRLQRLHDLERRLQNAPLPAGPSGPILQPNAASPQR